MEKTHPAIKLMVAMEDLFASGADENTSESELLALLDGLCWRRMVQSIVHNAVVLYEYTVDGPLCYRGQKLLAACDRGFRLYQTTEPAQIVDGVTYQRSLELWVGENMELFVTSCFHVSSGHVTTEYRDWKSKDWMDTELEISFSALSRNLKMLCELAVSGTAPFYEVSCV